MGHRKASQPDYGTGQKKLSTYTMGLVACSVLTVISFWTVMAGNFSKGEMIAIIYISACIQFLVQIIYFIRLNTHTKQARSNVMALLFTGVVLVCIIAGSLWIMFNVNYNMMH